MLAGQTIDVGQAEVRCDNNMLYVKYILDPGLCLAETHLSVKNDPANFEKTKTGNPIPGQFKYSSEDRGCETTQEYKVGPCPTNPSSLYIAAHAVVYDEVADLDGLEASLPNTVQMTVSHPGTTTGDPSYWDIRHGWRSP